MFVVEVGAALTTIYVIKDVVIGAGGLLFGHSNRSMAMVHGAFASTRESQHVFGWQYISNLSSGKSFARERVGLGLRSAWLGLPRASAMASAKLRKAP